MATELSRDEMRRLAQLGAERRLEELRQEEAAIRAAFPGLGRAAGGERGGRRPGRPPASAAATPAADSPAATPTRRRRRRKMSAAEKRAVSERMRKYWAARRKAKG